MKLPIKINKLYVKIFLAFLFLLVITEILILVFFRILIDKPMQGGFKRIKHASHFLLIKSTEEKLRDGGHLAFDKNKLLQKHIDDLGEIFQARVWLESPDNTVIAQSFEGEIPELPKHALRPHPKENCEKDCEKKFHRSFHRNFKRGPPPLFREQIRFPNNKKGHLNILHDFPGEKHYGSLFTVGLMAIGLIIALLLFPFSRFITVPLRKFSETALKIADGDLGQRVSIKGNDEIGHLGYAFNNMAESVEKMIISTKELTANISHELRSPLARIRIAQEILGGKLEKSDVSGYEKLMGSINGEIEEMDHLIGQILKLSKLDIRETNPENKQINISMLIQELLDKFSSSIEHKSIKLKTGITSEAVSIMGSPEDIRTALSNLLDNAVKFTPQGGTIELTVSQEKSKEKLKEKNNIQIIISNDSDSLPDSDINRIFEPFYRFNPSSTSGYGLGLAMTRKIIEKHKGSIEASLSKTGLVMSIRLN
ncbi:MAG: HAMP domain-containing histidine kinase [bacterium]|nr:HAMP domain-containing histidine kinase [bacterium]